ncbi:MAG: LuxR C-terminal-related transcriptional regulator [Dehalococcoidia bacterium]
MLSGSDSPKSVLLAHRHTLLREGIACLLREGGFQVVGQTDNVAALKELMTTHHPDVVLVDWELSDGGAEATESLVSMADQQTRSVIAVLTRPQPTETVSTAIKTGVGGYLSVNMSPEEFISALRIVSMGDMVVSREAASDIKNELAGVEPNQPKDDLSGREQEVLNLVSRGATNREIAGNLTITENTVKVHLRRILDKLNLRNRQQAAAFAAQEGLVDDVLEDIESPGPGE